MTLAPDKIELAQQIADALKEGIDAGPHVYYCLPYDPTPDYCKNLIRPLLGKDNIEILLESLPPNDARSLRDKHNRLMSCFDPTGELLDKSLRLTTVDRYANDLIEELRNMAQEDKQDIKATKQKANRPGPRIKHSDEILELAQASFEEFYLECNDAKQAWNKVADHHGFPSWTAARQACYRFKEKRNK